MQIWQLCRCRYIFQWDMQASLTAHVISLWRNARPFFYIEWKMWVLLYKSVSYIAITLLHLQPQEVSMKNILSAWMRNGCSVNILQNQYMIIKIVGYDLICSYFYASHREDTMLKLWNFHCNCCQKISIMCSPHACMFHCSWGCVIFSQAIGITAVQCDRCRFMLHAKNWKSLSFN